MGLKCLHLLVPRRTRVSPSINVFLGINNPIHLQYAPINVFRGINKPLHQAHAGKSPCFEFQFKNLLAMKFVARMLDYYS